MPIALYLISRVFCFGLDVFKFSGPLCKGPMDLNTVTRRDIMPISSVRRPDKPPVPKANLKYDGLDFAQGTLNGEYLKNIQVKKPEKSRKTEDNLKIGRSRSVDSGFSGDSTSSSDYKQGFTTVRPQKVCYYHLIPSSNMAFDYETFFKGQ